MITIKYDDFTECSHDLLESIEDKMKGLDIKDNKIYEFRMDVFFHKHYLVNDHQQMFTNIFNTYADGFKKILKKNYEDNYQHISINGYDGEEHIIKISAKEDKSPSQKHKSYSISPYRPGTNKVILNFVKDKIIEMSKELNMNNEDWKEVLDIKNRRIVLSDFAALLEQKQVQNKLKYFLEQRNDKNKRDIQNLVEKKIVSLEEIKKFYRK